MDNNLDLDALNAVKKFNLNIKNLKDVKANPELQGAITLLTFSNDFVKF